MPKAKAFAPRKPRTKPYSTNPKTARIREIEQSRVGLSAEIARINARYRTRFFRAKAKLHKSSKWQQLLKIDQIEKEKDLKASLDTEEEQELKKAAKTWIELMNVDVEVDSEGEQGSDSGDDTDSESSGGGIASDNDGMDESDSQFEDDGDNPSENEDLFDENENKIQVEDLTEGIKDIVTRHVRQLMTTLRKYEVIDGEGSASNGEQDESKE